MNVSDAAPGGMVHSTPAGGGLPRNYPLTLERDVDLADGRTVHIRPILPSDGERLRKAIDRTDPHAVRALLGAHLKVDEAAIRHLTQVDYHRRLTLVAVTPDGQGAGVARYEADHDLRIAQVAVAVETSWRRVGLASSLFRMLAEAAAVAGVGRFHAMFQAENPGAEALLRASGFPYSTMGSEGVLEAEVELPQPGD